MEQRDEMAVLHILSVTSFCYRMDSICAINPILEADNNEHTNHFRI